MSSDPLALVELRTGSKVAQTTLVVTTISLELLFTENPIAFIEGVELARHPKHKLFGNAGEVLYEYGILQEGGEMHDDTRAIIIASVEGEGLKLSLVNPLLR